MTFTGSKGTIRSARAALAAAYSQYPWYRGAAIIPAEVDGVRGYGLRLDVADDQNLDVSLLPTEFQGIHVELFRVSPLQPLVERCDGR